MTLEHAEGVSRADRGPSLELSRSIGSLCFSSCFQTSFLGQISVVVATLQAYLGKAPTFRWGTQAKAGVDGKIMTAIDEPLH